MRGPETCGQGWGISLLVMGDRPGSRDESRAAGGRADAPPRDRGEVRFVSRDGEFCPLVSTAAENVVVSAGENVVLGRGDQT